MKIDIIGSVASGKTTLAKRISERFNVPYYEKIILFGKELQVVISKEVRRNEINIFMQLLQKRSGLLKAHQGIRSRKVLGAAIILLS